MSKRSRRVTRRKRDDRPEVLRRSYVLPLIGSSLLIGGLTYMFQPNKIVANDAPSFDKPLTLIQTVTPSATETETPNFEGMRQRLVLLERYPQLAAQAQDLRMNFAEVRSVLEAARSNCTGCSLDLILQAHPSFRTAPSPSEASSQERIYRYLEATQPKVIVAEGTTLVPFTFELGIRQLVSAGVTRDEARKFYRLETPKWAYMRYLAEHPDAKVVGAEYETANYLHMDLIRLEQAQQGRDSFITDSREQLGAVRSTLAVARALQALAANGGGRAAVLMGNYHADDLMRSARAYGVEANLYDGTQ